MKKKENKEENQDLFFEENKKQNEEKLFEINEDIEKNVSDIGRNIGGGTRLLLEAGNTGVKIGVRTISLSLRVVGWVLIPVMSIGSGIWSVFNVENDCDKILNIFSAKFPKYKCESLKKYAESFQNVIEYFEELEKKNEN